MPNYDLIVVGGGIVGASTAYHAVLRGARTLLIDRADLGLATAAGAGIIAPEGSKVESDDWFTFAIGAADYYPKLIAQLQADGAGETGYAPTDELIVAVSEDEDEAFLAMRSRINLRQERHDRPQPGDLEPIDTAVAQARFPGLAPLRYALHHRRAARVDGRLLTHAMREAALQHRLELRKADAEALIYNDQTVVGVRVAGEEIYGGAIVLAGGAWSSHLTEPIGLKLPVQPQRGQIIHLKLPGVDTSDWPIVSAFHGHYILPWPDSRVVVGATREWVGFQPTTTAVGVQEVLAEALRVAPGLAKAEIGEIRVGLRPGTPDTLPILGPVDGYKNLLLATGHGPLGLTLGPISGQQIAQLALGEASEYNLAPYGLSRFTQE